MSKFVTTHFHLQKGKGEKRGDEGQQQSATSVQSAESILRENSLCVNSRA